MSLAADPVLACASSARECSNAPAGDVAGAAADAMKLGLV
jgi:hypothetical protein